MLSINTNISSLITQTSMKQSTSKLNQAIERMTTGFKINHASDNTANYSISTNMTTKINSYMVAEDNAAMGLDLISTAEGTLNQIQDKLERLRALQEQASNGTYGEESLKAINAEANALVDEINRLYSTAEYNGMKLFEENMQTTGFINTITRRDTSAMTNTVLGRESTDSEITGSLMCDGFISSLSACFGCMPITSFSQNVGLLAMTKVVNRYTIATGAGILVLAGIFPAIGAVLATLPEAVLGGCTIMMFGNIVISGLRMIGACGFSQRNITIAALSLSVGLGFTQVPEMFEIFPDIIQTIFAENCVAVVFLTAIIMNLIMPTQSEA